MFNLTLVEHAGEEGGGMSIWDGAQFAYTESKGWGWGYWDLARMSVQSRVSFLSAALTEFRFPRWWRYDVCSHSVRASH